MELIDELRRIYETRDIDLVEPFIDKWATSDTITSGTCMDELSIGKGDLFELIENDLKYWYDLEILPNYEKEEIKGYTFLHLHAYSILKVNENEERYQ